MARETGPSALRGRRERGSAGEVVLTPQALRLTQVARESFPDVPERSGIEKLHAVRKRVERHRALRRGSRRPLVGLAAAAVLVLAVVTVGRNRGAGQGEGALSYRTEGVEASDDGYLRGRSDGASRVVFSDGSSVAMTGSSRIRLASLEPQGATVGLDEGTVRVDVVHRPDTRWHFDAGPFRVLVKGTRFDLAWSKADGQFEVRLSQGEVAVKTPLSADPIRLTSGHRLTVQLAQHRVLIDPLPADSAAGDAPRTAGLHGSAPTGSALAADSLRAAPLAAADAPSPPPARHGARREPPSAPSSERSGSWATYLAEGRLQEILDEAQRRGLDAAVTESTSEDLAALADAARYKGRPDIAERALHKQRARFAGSVRARDAAFLLGRLHESRGSSGLAAALTWYDRYLVEAPSGSYAAEALGRKMTATERLSGKDAARPLALQYLERYPAGAYAPAARALTRRP